MSDISMKSFGEILGEYENMIHYLIYKLGIRDPEKEFYQEGTVALWKAVEAYEKKRGKFSSYAYFRIEKALLSLIRKNNRNMENEAAYLNSCSMDTTPLTSTLDIDFDPYLLESIKQALTDNQMKWFSLFVLEDMPIKVIAEKEDVTVNTVKSWARHAKPRIREILRIY
ncbi:sigma-70 family RNA polymerase sigma factor [Sediminibacillus massiliensis]|uniref:sigma-70 family RNA polymerase sigma factor n=1 Tax=Sediminibacillus massiliensis TaxID=1926277 RepID=UPI0009883606|nr:sigma-70 family RNA polymerase sigma factor [Sediminibacillus massiliensis]